MTLSLVRAFNWPPDVIGAQLVSEVEMILSELFNPEGGS